MKSENVIAFLIVVSIACASIYGWVCNIITICNSNFDHITGMLVCRCIGVFVAPLGAVLGYFN